MTSCFRVKSLPNVPLVLSRPPDASRFLCGCRRRLHDFRPLRPGLAPHYLPQMWLAETHYPVGNALPAVIIPEVVLMLAIHPRDDFRITFLSDSQQVFRILMAPLNLTYLLQYLAKQVKQPAGHLARLVPAALALFPVCKARFLHVKELCPGTVDSQSPAQLAHRRIVLFDPFPQQPRVSRITYIALIARRGTSGCGCCRSAVPTVSDSRVPCTSSGTSGSLSLQA